MDPGSSQGTSSSPLNWSSDSDLSRHAWIALAALAIAVPIQASIQHWVLNRRKPSPVSNQRKVVSNEVRNSPTKPSNRPVLNTIDEEDDDQDVHQSLSSKEPQNDDDASQDQNPTPKSKRSKDRRKRGPNLLKERSSRARQRVASWTLAASSEHDKSAHAVTALQPPADLVGSSNSHMDKDNGKGRRKRDTSIASSSRTGTESAYGDLDEVASETASQLRFDAEPEQLAIIRAPSTSTSTSVSAADSYLDNSSVASASLSVPTSAPESSVTCASNIPDPSRMLAAAEQEAAPPLERANAHPNSNRSETKYPPVNSTPSSPARGVRKKSFEEHRGSPNLAHPRPISNHNLDTRSITSSPSLNYSPAPNHDSRKESTVLYDTAISNAQNQAPSSHSNGEPVVSLTTQISSLKGALSASRQREENLKAQCARLTAELQEARWRLGLWPQTHFQAQPVPWAQQQQQPQMPQGALPMWGYPAASGSNSAPHSHPMTPLMTNYPGSGTFPHQNWGMTPLRDLKNKSSKEQVSDNEETKDEEDDRLDTSPIAEAILKRPGTLSRSRSRTGISSDGSNPKEAGSSGEDKNPNSSEHTSPSFNGQEIPDENLETEVNHSKDVDKPFMDELVFPSLLGS